MVIVLYMVAALLLVASFALAAGGQLMETDLLILAVGCLLLARLTRIERRLDKMEGIELRQSRIERVASWAWSNRTEIVGFGWLALCIGSVWYSWPIVDRTWLHTAGAMHPVLLVWIPLGGFVAFVILGLLGLWAGALALLLGYAHRPGKALLNLKVTDEMEYIGAWMGIAWGLDVLFVALPYADKHFAATFPALNHWLSRPTSALQVCTFFALVGGWMPLGFIAGWLQRRRGKKATAARDPSAPGESQVT